MHFFSSKGNHFFFKSKEVLKIYAWCNLKAHALYMFEFVSVTGSFQVIMIDTLKNVYKEYLLIFAQS